MTEQRASGRKKRRNGERKIEIHKFKAKRREKRKIFSNF